MKATRNHIKIEKIIHLIFLFNDMIQNLDKFDCFKKSFLKSKPNLKILYEIRENLNEIIKYKEDKKKHKQNEIQREIEKKKQYEIQREIEKKQMIHNILETATPIGILLDTITSYISDDNVRNIIYDYIYNTEYKIYKREYTTVYTNFYNSINGMNFHFMCPYLRIFDMYNNNTIKEITVLCNDDHKYSCHFEYILGSIKNKIIWFYYKTNVSSYIDEYDVDFENIKNISTISINKRSILQYYGCQEEYRVTEMMYDNGYLYFYNTRINPIILFEIDYKTSSFNRKITIDDNYGDQFIINNNKLYNLSGSQITIYDIKNELIEKKDIIITRDLIFNEMKKKFGTPCPALYRYDNILCFKNNYCILFALLSFQSNKYIIEYNFHKNILKITKYDIDDYDIRLDLSDITFYNNCYFLKANLIYFIIANSICKD
jgi:hypothetical protein